MEVVGVVDFKQWVAEQERLILEYFGNLDTLTTSASSGGNIAPEAH